MKIALLTAIATFSFSALAEGAATMKCTGQNIVLEVKSPYLGEEFTPQKLYVLKSKNNNQGETKNTAYFLNVEEDITGVNQGGAGRLMFSSDNQNGSVFEMIIDPWTDESDGTTIRQTSKGDITYNLGHLTAVQEPVSCVIE